MKTEFAEKYITLGLKIAYYRKKAGYTQETFAELIDKSVNFVMRLIHAAIARTNLTGIFSIRSST